VIEEAIAGSVLDKLPALMTAVQDEGVDEEGVEAPPGRLFNVASEAPLLLLLQGREGMH
jgi:hypothetical protein